MGKEVTTLRGIIKKSPDCNKRFKEAEKLAKLIFSKKTNYVPLPFFTRHDNKHCETIERYLNEIIWKRKEKSEYDFIPNIEESMYLLSGVWLHDIGMWYGLWDEEKPKDLVNIKTVINLREEHECRTLRYIQEKWESCSWSQTEKEYLSNICFYHRSKHPIITLDPPKVRGNYIEGNIRLGFLASLLRIADAWHIDESRAPASLENFYISLGMEQESQQHWKKSSLIRKVEKKQ